MLLFVIITVLALAGLGQSKRINNVLVALKLAIVLFIIAAGALLMAASTEKSSTSARRVPRL